MNIRTLIVVLALIAILLFFYQVGIDTTSVFIVLSVTVIWTGGYYFSTRNSEIEPTNFEVSLATIWLILRRIIFFSLAIFLLRKAVLDILSPEISLDNIGFSLALMLPALICISIGIYGYSGDFVNFWPFSKDTIAKHKSNKNRYKWRW